MTDKYLQEQFIGKTFTEKLNEDIGKYFIERKFSKLGFLPRPGVIGVCNVLDENKEEILALGGSEPFDQINDNFGKWMTAICCPINNTDNSPSHEIGTSTDPPVPISGVVNGQVFWYNKQQSHYSASGGGISQIQLGQGTTTPLITDFNIETPLGSAPENLISTINGTGIYTGTGQVNFVRLFGPTGGTGTITEMGWFMRMRYGAGGGGPNPNPSTFMFSHDLINPTVPYSVGQFIMAEYFITI